MSDLLDRIGIRKPNNQGIITTTGAGVICHDLPTGRTAIIRKIMAYNATGANINFTFGTLDATPAYVALTPSFVAIDPFDNEWPEEEIIPVEFALDTSAAGAFRLGDIWILGSAAGLIVMLEVEEFGG